jgi:heme-degrading monooxygenase HmoA
VTEEEPQAVITLTEYDFQDAFKKWKKHWNQYICVEGDYFEGDDGQ